MNKKILASAILSVLSFGALADTPSFDNLEIGFANMDFDGGIDLDGYEFKGSKMISDNLYIAGDYTDVSKNGFDASLTTFGIGYKNDFSNSSSFFTELDYASFESDGGLDEDGYELTFGVRSMMTDQFEVKVALEYLEIDSEDTTSFVIGGAYDLGNDIALYADYKYESDLSRYGVGLRYNF